MMDAAKTILLVLSALFPIVNPLGGSPIFLALTGEYSPEGRKALSRQIAINSFFLLIGSYFIGTYILAFFGISLPVVQVGGGLIVISNGWIMLKRGAEGERDEVGRDRQPNDPLLQAFYPLTLPLTVGPGSISVAITLGANAAHRHIVDLWGNVAAIIGSALIALSIFLCYRFSERLAQTLGATAMSVILRLSSFLLVCIGVQIMWNGISALLSSLPSHPR